MANDERRKTGDDQRLALSLSLSLSLYLLLALVTTHPLWLRLADAVPGDIGDPLLNTWTLAWDAHALLTHPLRLFDANVFYPLPNTLAYSEHLLSTAALILPLQLLIGEPVVAYNLSLLLSFPLAGLGMYLLVFHWTRRRGAAFLAGLAFAFAPYRLAAISHLQLLTVQWLPFSLLALDRALESQMANRRSSVFPPSSLVIFATLQILASWYLAVFTGLVLGGYTLGWLVAHRLALLRDRRLLGPLLISAAAFAAVVGLSLPFALPYLDVLPQLQAARPPTLAASFAAHPTDFLTAAPYLRIAGPPTQPLAARHGFTEENALFLGLITLILALVGLASLARSYPRDTARWQLVTLAAILVASLALTFAGPYRVLTRIIPPLAVVRVPPRWIIPATFVLAALAGYGAAWLGYSGQQKADSRRQEPHAPAGSARTTCSPVCRLLPAVCCLLIIAESFSAPLPLAPVGSRADLPPVYHVLREEAFRRPPDWAVVELPMHVAPAPEFPETKRLYASTLGWWGLVNGYSGFTPARQESLGRALAGFPDDTALATLRSLGAAGVRYLIVHPDEAPLDRTRWETTDRWRVERGTSLLPLGRFGPDDLYLINPYGDALITDPTIVTDPYWSAQAPVPANVRFTASAFDGEIRLLAYSLLPTPHSLLPTETRLTLYWQTSASLDTNYTVFVHSLSAAGEIIGQADGPPVANHHPTSAWRPGEIVQDSRLVLPGDRYRVGLYDPVTGRRLSAFSADGFPLPDDAVVLTASPQRP